MDNETLALECMKLATSLISPTVNDRITEVANAQTKLYNHIKLLCDDTVVMDTPKRGRPPKAQETDETNSAPPARTRQGTQPPQRAANFR